MVGKQEQRKPGYDQPVQKKNKPVKEDAVERNGHGKGKRGRGGKALPARAGRGSSKILPTTMQMQQESVEEREKEPERGEGDPGTSSSSGSSSSSSSSGGESEGTTDHEGSQNARHAPKTLGRGRGPAEQVGSSKRAPTKRSYSDLVSGKLEDGALKALFRSLPRKRAAERQRLMADLQAAQPQWLLALRGGFNLLFYGLGSKKDMLQDFVRSSLMENGAVIAVNGYVPSLTGYKVVSYTVAALSGKAARSCGSTSKDMLNFLHAEAASNPTRTCFVVVHNIDGPGLRAEGEQALLADLASCPNVCLAASIDHVNAPLLWNKAMEAKFRWLWIDATTYAPYITETLDKPSILAGTFQQARQRGAGAVLRSMVANAREVYALLVAHQLEDPESEGLDFKLLFRMCRERFLLTNELALKVHITEFTDHQMLATRRSAEGAGEVMYIPMDTAGLQRVTEELEAIKAEAE